MPIQTRTFVYNEIKAYYDKQNEDPNSLEKQVAVQQKIKEIQVPDFLVKAPKR